jgi:hypothetical protein
MYERIEISVSPAVNAILHFLLSSEISRNELTKDEAEIIQQIYHGLGEVDQVILNVERV